MKLKLIGLRRDGEALRPAYLLVEEEEPREAEVFSGPRPPEKRAAA